MSAFEGKADITNESARVRTERLPVAFHPFLPRFNDARLERQYRDSRAEYRPSAIRISCFAGIAIWVLFTSLDRLTIHDPSAPLFYVRILGIISLIPIISHANLRRY
jgi:hypothetical protein